jgi:hypothetical protein
MLLTLIYRIECFYALISCTNDFISLQRHGVRCYVLTINIDLPPLRPEDLSSKVGDILDLDTPTIVAVVVSRLKIIWFATSLLLLEANTSSGEPKSDATDDPIRARLSDATTRDIECKSFWTSFNGLVPTIQRSTYAIQFRMVHCSWVWCTSHFGCDYDCRSNLCRQKRKGKVDL